MRILIGSTALKQYIDLKREPKDIDYFVSSDWAQNSYNSDVNKKVEVFYYHSIVNYFGKNTNRTATLDELYTIKISHIFWDLKNASWEKHCYDIMQMKQAGAEFLDNLYNLLYPIWEERYGKKKANLSSVPEDFFKSTVTRIYDHDSIHKSVAYYDEPMYKAILKDGHQVLVDKSRWDVLSHDDKLKTVREEAYATALERQLIPSGYTTSRRAAYQWALKKTITSFSKGWFPLFIALNLGELWKPDIDFVEKHLYNKSKLVVL